MSTAPVAQTRIGVSDPRRLMVERAAVLLGRAWRSVGRGWAHWRKQAGERQLVAHGGLAGGGLSAWMGRTLTGKGARTRVLAVEERLTLGPKQHMFLIRCGEQRLLVASAGEGALQWMALPEETGPKQLEACDKTGVRTGKAELDATQGTAKTPARRKSRAGSAARKAAGEGTR